MNIFPQRIFPRPDNDQPCCSGNAPVRYNINLSGYLIENFSMYLVNATIPAFTKILLVCLNSINVMLKNYRLFVYSYNPKSFNSPGTNSRYKDQPVRDLFSVPAAIPRWRLWLCPAWFFLFKGISC